ncbi:hypothetical protein swp_4831 [Shewanella piezotolerans WP3]|uniref:Uncharacterized protein n=1 Tax=Shewanella piezotolerans (strain WP3 / JCM 13877) TaxID=225849 RepID=B8CUX9_SHEPW|nr:hypothetical protein swp_4831 [Shewanella piezotolerans WP3]
MVICHKEAGISQSMHNNAQRKSQSDFKKWLYIH